ncbi:MAG: bacteriohemerythrin [Acidobacteria bacterium]|nr:bacteriohemerythrin [Acidobacteriota bacterium]
MARRARLFVWKHSYDTDIAEIDAQHREIAGILNSLHRSLGAGAPRTGFLPIIDELIRHTVVHFATEERMMLATAYPNAEHHRMDHVLLRTRVLNFRRAAETESKTNPGDMLRFLESWLDRHIQGPDQALAGHLHTQGMQ